MREIMCHQCMGLGEVEDWKSDFGEMIECDFCLGVGRYETDEEEETNVKPQTEPTEYGTYRVWPVAVYDGYGPGIVSMDVQGCNKGSFQMSLKRVREIAAILLTVADRVEKRDAERDAKKSQVPAEV